MCKDVRCKEWLNGDRCKAAIENRYPFQCIKFMEGNYFLGAYKITGEKDLMFVRILAENEDEADEKLYNYLEGREIPTEKYEIISSEEIDLIL